MKEEYKKDILHIREILHGAKHAVFFGGAGVSTDSGIPDFRGNGGLYAGDGANNEYYLSRECLLNEPARFYEYYRKNMVFKNAKPNRTHKALAELEKRGIIKTVITQNIDGLHQEAGSNRVIELHGTANRFYCDKCKKSYDKDCLDISDCIPVCDDCKGIIRPDIVLYGERLDGFAFADAENEVMNADVLIAGGSSLKVYPAASLVDSFTGKHLIIINYTPTPYDSKAEYVIRESISDVFEELL